jgi:hypothetical protein
MAKKQDDFFQEQLSKTTDLRIICDGVKSTSGSGLASTTTTARFSTHNGGNKSADGFYWELLLPEGLAYLIRFLDEDGGTIEGKMSHLSETEHYKKVDGHYTHKLFPYSGIEVARISFTANIEQFDVMWRIRGEDGMIPPVGLAKIRFTRLSDGTYRWTRWHPGQDTDSIQP